MQRAVIYIISETVSVIDNTPEAETRLAAIDILEERRARESRKQRRVPAFMAFISSLLSI